MGPRLPDGKAGVAGVAVAATAPVPVPRRLELLRPAVLQLAEPPGAPPRASPRSPPIPAAHKPRVLAYVGVQKALLLHVTPAGLPPLPQPSPQGGRGLSGCDSVELQVEEGARLARLDGPEFIDIEAFAALHPQFAPC